MGFYGKVEHTDRIQFTIDKVYQSRYDMEQALVKNEDSVFIGRYVLVDYDTTGKNYLRLFKENNNNYLNFSIDLDKSTRAIFEGNTDFSVTSDQIVYTLDEQLRQKFFRCNGSKTEGGIKYATFIEIETPAEENPNSYYQNYQKDLIYGESRGYDSTVWQKIYVDEKEEYVMIAELNSVVPTFNIVSDAPTVEPVAPHFDSDSTNVYYRLHLQPQWGMRIKKANGADSSDDTKVKSDEKVKYDGKSSYDGAIYYNKAGFEKETRSKDTTTDNKVSILPTGISHASYNKHDSNNPSAVSEQIDTQEISILLPALGNAISDVWDMVYGENRNLDIYWDSPHGLRLTRDDVGFAYKTNEIQTLAGCINTAHDLLGMIIRADTTEVGDASIDNIYYGDLENKGATAYYLKEPYMKFTKLTNAEALKLMTDKPTKVDPPLVEFSEGSYHIATTWGFSHDKTKTYKKGTQYYKINATNIQLDDTYAANKYYYQPKENLNYLLDQNSTPTRTNDYYSITFNAKTSVASDTIKTYFYKPEAHVDNEDGSYTGLFYLDENDVLYKIDGIDDPGFYDVIGHYDSNDTTKWVGYFIGENYTSKIENDETTGQPVRVYSFKKKTPVQMIKFTYSASNKTGNYYYKDNNNNYICLTNINQVDTKISYGLLTLTKKNKFYEPDIYYYIGGDDYIKGNSTDMIEGVQYVVLSGHTEPLKTAFYEPSEYYYLDALGNYVLDNNPTMTKNRDYYIKKFVYVYNDSEGILTQGTKWNINVTEIPPNIELASGEVDYRWKELVGFSKDLNTINGLIVRINSLIKFDDYTTRDQKTVQGCINRLNDIINTFDTLKPHELVIVDDHGRITCAPTSGDSWVKVDVDSRIDSKKIEITHIGPVAPSGNEQAPAAQAPAFGENAVINTFYFDSKGHKNKDLSYNIKIPKGSLNDTQASGADVITQLSFVDSTGALSTTRSNIAALKLTGYSKGSVNTDVEAGDTLGSALSKLQTQIIDEENTRSAAIAAEQKARAEAIQQEQTDRATAINTAIQSLDSEKSQVEGADGLALNLKIVDGKIDSFSGSIKANTYDAYGAASAVLGTTTDTANNKTVYGAHAYAADIATNIENNYIKQTAAPGYADILTKTAAKDAYEPIGAESRAKTYADTLAPNYATAAQGALAATAVQPAALENYYTKTLIDELIARIQTLETKVAALESAENPA